MEGIRTYILSVTAAAILCAALTALAGKGSSYAPLLKLLTGIVMAAVVIRPIAEVSTVNLGRYLDSLNADAAAAVEAGTKIAREETSVRIKEELESYILDKAADLSLDISVELELDAKTLLPAAVVIDGMASPFAKGALATVLQDELGIPEEAMKWK